VPVVDIIIIEIDWVCSSHLQIWRLSSPFWKILKLKLIAYMC